MYNQVAYWAMDIDTSSLLKLLDEEDRLKIQRESSDSTTTFLHSGEIKYLANELLSNHKNFLHRFSFYGCAIRASIVLGERCRAEHV